MNNTFLRNQARGVAFYLMHNGYEEHANRVFKKLRILQSAEETGVHGRITDAVVRLEQIVAEAEEIQILLLDD